jgi:hypothetical protein
VDLGPPVEEGTDLPQDPAILPDHRLPHERLRLFREQLRDEAHVQRGGTASLEFPPEDLEIAGEARSNAGTGVESHTKSGDLTGG